MSQAISGGAGGAAGGTGHGTGRGAGGGPAGEPVSELAELERRAAQRRATFGEGSHIVCDNLVRIYQTDGIEVLALQGLDLLVERGEMLALVGASGSGKTTLLNILSGLDLPTAGVARVAGADLLSMSARERLRFRREVVGFLWQQTSRNLIPSLSAAENVELPMRFAGVRRRERGTRAAELLELIGVTDCAGRRPHQMSGGQRQRVAIAVATANRPDVLLADEPTGELDTTTSTEVFGALRRANRELGVTVVVVTHDPLVADQVDRTVAIRDGRTSTEVVRAAGSGPGHGEEYTVVDRAGRLQLPREFMTALEIRRRVRLALEPDHIAVRPAGDGGESAREAADGGASEPAEGEQ